MLLIIAVVFIGLGIMIMRTQRWKDSDIKATSSAGQYHNVTYDGEAYTYNQRITAIALIGTDTTDPFVKNSVYGQAPRSDAVVLLVLDESTSQMTVIMLNRNTMTEIQMYDLYGDPIGKSTKQLAYAYAEGDGTTVSCENTAEAISDLLYGIPVSDYIACNMDSIRFFHELIAPIDVTVPNDDLADLYPEMYAGNLVSLTDGQMATDFLHTRDVGVSFSNNSRMERQKTYMQAYMDKMLSYLRDGHVEEVVENIDIAKDDGLLVTNISRSKYIRFFNLFAKMELDNIVFYSPEGSNDNRNELEEFYIDEDDLIKQVISIFYREK